MRRFENKIVLVTGAAKGIGLAASIEFAAEGAHVVATDVDLEALEAAEHQIATHGAVEAYSHDVVNEDGWRSIVEKVIQCHGRLDVLVNNAGIGIFADVENTTLELWRKTMAVNADAVFLGTRIGIEVMKERGGVIVNVASIASEVGEPLLAAYNASKGSVKMFTKAAAIHCARAGYPIRIVSLHPGYSWTPMFERGLAALTPDEAAVVLDGVKASIPMARVANPREMARPLLFLASDDASYMTGAGLIIDGGFTAV